MSRRTWRVLYGLASSRFFRLDNALQAADLLSARYGYAIVIHSETHEIAYEAVQ